MPELTLAAGLIVRWAPAANANAARDQVRTWLAVSTPWQRTDHGKPFLTDGAWSFNYSHTDGAVALIAAPGANHDLGIDLEALTRARDWPRLTRRYFHLEEQAHAHTPADCVAIWTRKEAVLKASGLGLRTDLKSLNTQTQPVIGPEGRAWQVVTQPVASAWILSAAWPLGAFDVSSP